MGRTDWLGALRNQACFGTSRRRRLIRVQHIEVLERRAAPSDAFGFITGSAALGGSLIAGDDLQADPSKHLDAPQAGRAGGVSPPSNDARLPISSPPEAPPSFDASISEPATAHSSENRVRVAADIRPARRPARSNAVADNGESCPGRGASRTAAARRFRTKRGRRRCARS
jgi:hypothetical protein